jgi:Tfp pilus assembly protein PilO
MRLRRLGEAAALQWRRFRQADLNEMIVPVGGALLAVLVLNLLFYVGLTRPRLDQASGSRATLGEEERRLRAEERRMAEERRRLSFAHCVEHDLDRFFEEVIQTKEERMTRVQKAVRDLAVAFRMNPENIAYQAHEDRRTGIVEFGVSFPLQGSYENLRQFLQHVEASEHFLVVDAISLEGSPEGGVTLQLVIRLSTFFRGPEGGEPTA